MKNSMPALRMLIFMTVLTGIGYPLAVTGLGQLLFPHQAAGSIVRHGETVLGSEFVAQNFENSKYFWPRPSSQSFNPLPSGGSNLGQISADLKKIVDGRREKLMALHPGAGEPPQDLLFASGSGLDPEISPEGARYQILRVASARGLDVNHVAQLVKQQTKDRQFGLFGEPRINVLLLNMALDESQGGGAVPTGDHK